MKLFNFVQIIRLITVPSIQAHHIPHILPAGLLSASSGRAQPKNSSTNGDRPTIKFTVEQEEDGTLLLLDTLLRRREGGRLDISFYRKPMHTDQYLHFESSRGEMSS